MAGFSNTTGIANSFFGVRAGTNNASGAFNSFFGLEAGINNLTGGNNSFFGLHTGVGNMTGSSITLIGANADVGADNLNWATAIGAGAVVSSSNAVVLGRIGDVVGIGTHAPKTKLHLTGGKIYMEANGQGVILKSPSGACVELTVTDAGALTTAVVACP